MASEHTFTTDPLKLAAGTYFLVMNPGREPVAFMRDEDGRFTRLHDGVYADGFFASWNPDRIAGVTVTVQARACPPR